MTLFAKLESVFWPFWGSKKSFSGLFRSCLGVVQELFKHCFRSLKPHFWVYFQLQRLINDPENRNFRSKICSFCRFEGSFLTILGVEKIAFWTFSKFFGSCVGTVLVFFQVFEAPFLGVFSAQKVDKRPRKLKFAIKNLLILAILRGLF